MATTDLSFLYASRAYQKAYADLLMAIRECKGFVLLTGAEGSGKTTLLCQLMRHADARARYLFFDGTTLPNATFEDFLHFLSTELGLHQDRDGRSQKLQALGACLAARSKKEGVCRAADRRGAQPHRRSPGEPALAVSPGHGQREATLADCAGGSAPVGG